MLASLRSSGFRVPLTHPPVGSAADRRSRGVLIQSGMQHRAVGVLQCLAQGFHSARARSQDVAKPGESVAKPIREWRVKLKDGREACVRRPQPSDTLGLYRFLFRTPVGERIFRPHSDTPTGYAGSNFRWDPTDPEHYAFIAVVDGEVVGVTQLDRQPHEMERPVDTHFLATQGLTESEVCISRMVIACSAQGQGLAHSLKAAQVVAAQDAGFKGVASETASDAIKAVVKAAGGVVSGGSSRVWTLVKVGQRSPPQSA